MIARESRPQKQSKIRWAATDSVHGHCAGAAVMDAAPAACRASRLANPTGHWSLSDLPSFKPHAPTGRSFHLARAPRPIDNGDAPGASRPPSPCCRASLQPSRIPNNRQARLLPGGPPAQLSNPGSVQQSRFYQRWFPRNYPSSRFSTSFLTLFSPNRGKQSAGV